LDKYESLLDLVKDDLTRNLVLLLNSERVATFSATLWISYLVFATQRHHLKYQMEIFLNKLIELVSSENNPKITYEHKELVLDMIVRLYKMPSFITQLYVNYDCDLYTQNIFEDLTKMLSKNAFPVTGLYSTQFLSLDALLTVVEAIEKQCMVRRS
jgi:brefeldin A-resistance guanine nucleotide exchange factor 1